MPRRFAMEYFKGLFVVTVYSALELSDDFRENLLEETT
jgi:hypothetical protein